MCTSAVCKLPFGKTIRERALVLSVLAPLSHRAKELGRMAAGRQNINRIGDRKRQVRNTLCLSQEDGNDCRPMNEEIVVL